MAAAAAAVLTSKARPGSDADGAHLLNSCSGSVTRYLGCSGALRSQRAVRQPAAEVGESSRPIGQADQQIEEVWFTVRRGNEAHSPAHAAGPRRQPSGRGAAACLPGLCYRLPSPLLAVTGRMETYILNQAYLQLAGAAQQKNKVRPCGPVSEEGWKEQRAAAKQKTRGVCTKWTHGLVQRCKYNCGWMSVFVGSTRCTKTS